tara:strand:- start:1092 stop:1439 length:348 start_codon:yes stop_codon:yes gene_type:complete
MLRSVKSTQRKMRQLELVIQADAADDTELAGTSGLKGPAAKQVKSCKRDNATGVFVIELMQPFADEPVIVGTNISATKGDNRKGGASADRIQIAYASASEKTSLVIIGSDTAEKY